MTITTEEEHQDRRPTGSGLYVDMENLNTEGQALIEGLIRDWPGNAPPPSHLNLYVRADHTELWRLWASSRFRDMEPTSTKQQQLIAGGSNPTTLEELEARKETPRDVVDRIADGKSQQGPILVINDEGHHCHRGDPDKKNALPQNTQWFEGIQQIRDTGLLRYVVDMSATPIFLAQSNPRPLARIMKVLLG